MIFSLISLSPSPVFSYFGGGINPPAHFTHVDNAYNHFSGGVNTPCGDFLKNVFNAAVDGIIVENTGKIVGETGFPSTTPLLMPL